MRKSPATAPAANTLNARHKTTSSSAKLTSNNTSNQNIPAASPMTTGAASCANAATPTSQARSTPNKNGRGAEDHSTWLHRPQMTMEHHDIDQQSLRSTVMHGRKLKAMEDLVSSQKAAKREHDQSFMTVIPYSSHDENAQSDDGAQSDKTERVGYMKSTPSGNSGNQFASMPDESLEQLVVAAMQELELRKRMAQTISQHSPVDQQAVEARKEVRRSRSMGLSESAAARKFGVPASSPMIKDRVNNGDREEIDWEDDEVRIAFEIGMSHSQSRSNSRAAGVAQPMEKMFHNSFSHSPQKFQSLSSSTPEPLTFSRPPSRERFLEKEDREKNKRGIPKPEFRNIGKTLDEFFASQKNKQREKDRNSERSPFSSSTTSAFEDGSLSIASSRSSHTNRNPQPPANSSPLVVSNKRSSKRK